MIVISILIVLLFLGILGGFLYFVWKRDWMKTTFSLATNILTALESFLFTRLYLHSFGSSLEDIYLEILESSNGTWVKQEATDDFLMMISYITVGVLFFIAIYFVLLVINHFIKKKVFSILMHQSYKEYQSEKSYPALKIGMGILSFYLTTFILLFPFGTACHVVNHSFQNCQLTTPKTVNSIVHNPVLQAYSVLGSRPFFNLLTKVDKSNYRLKNADELEGMTTIALSTVEILEDRNVEENIEVFRKHLHSTYLVSGFIGELVSNATLQFKENKPFMGVEVKVKDAYMESLLNDVFTITSQWNREDFLEDVDTLLDVYLLMRTKNLHNLEDSNALVVALEDESFSKPLFVELFENKDFKQVIPSVMNFGLNKLLKSLKIETDVEYIQTVNLDDFTKEDMENEAHIFSVILKQLQEIKNMKEGDIKVEDITNLYNNIQEIQKSKLIGDVLYNLLYRLVSTL